MYSMCFCTCEIKIAVKEIPANKNGNYADWVFKPQALTIAWLSKLNPPSHHFLLAGIYFTGIIISQVKKHILYDAGFTKKSCQTKNFNFHIFFLGF
jgi:hypothetical protein